MEPKLSLISWMQQNGWSLIIAVATIASTFVLYGYRIDNLEKQLIFTSSQITALNAQQVQTQVALAQIQVDLTYIKASLDRLK